MYWRTSTCAGDGVVSAAVCRPSSGCALSWCNRGLRLTRRAYRSPQRFVTLPVTADCAECLKKDKPKPTFLKTTPGTVPAAAAGTSTGSASKYAWANDTHGGDKEWRHTSTDNR